MALQIRTEELREEARIGRNRAQNVGTDSNLRVASVTSCGDHSTPALPNAADSIIDQLTNDLMSGLDLMKLKIQVDSTPKWVSNSITVGIKKQTYLNNKLLLVHYADAC